ncbi:MAG: ASPIC/UnbV domain-containing protein [Planctomycetota bacterium]|jgi:thiol-disulfide isomerase/thioredoxin|nr:ASPIC/UnbV domain-containing protein [Planctomycetota bacterium]MDP6987925.1 ASPIC/UnbV domain-containing protein [Planctomycetota bacterium]
MGERGNTRLLDGASLSGNERNHLFLNEGGREFLEYSGISGLDDPADARSVAILDYDTDGWLDLAVVNANAPLLRLYRNRIGDGGASTHGGISLRLVGGNQEARRSRLLSARDAYGARVRFEVDGRWLVREHTAGAGFAAQNSAALHLGIGAAQAAERLEIRWPSGRVSALSDVPRGAGVTAFEDPATSPDGEPFLVALPKRTPTPRGTARVGAVRRGADTPVLALPGAAPGKLTLYTTMATWCAPCVEELPTLAHLRAALGDERLAMRGIPHDRAQTAEELETWARAHQPPYELLTGLSAEEHAAVRGMLLETLRREGLPASIVTDAAGSVLLVRWGPPTVSELLLLHERLTLDR